jgi:hypothetical protein
MPLSSIVFRFTPLAWSFGLILSVPLHADPLDQQLLEDAPPKSTSPAKPSEQPGAPQVAAPNSSPPRSNPDQPLDTRHPLTRIAGKMELVERRLSTGVNSNIVGMQRDILADLERLLTPGDPKNAGSEKEGNPQPNSSPQDLQQNPSKQPANNKQPSSKQAGQGPESPNGSGTGEGDNQPRKPSPRELMEATWGNLPARERERVFEAAGESFLPKYARTLRLYFERLAEEDAEK